MTTPYEDRLYNCKECDSVFQPEDLNKDSICESCQQDATRKELTDQINIIKSHLNHISQTLDYIELTQEAKSIKTLESISDHLNDIASELHSIEG